MRGINSELLKQARARIKQSFVPIDPAQMQVQAAAPPPMDPAVAGGMPPPGAPPPMDPAAGGMPPPGAPPMDPAAGGMPPPPMDPAAMGGMPPDPSAGGAPPPMGPEGGPPPVNGTPLVVGLDDLLQLFEEISMSGAAAGAGAGESSGKGPNEPDKPKGSKASDGEQVSQLIEKVDQLLNALGGGDVPAPPGDMGAAPPDNALAPEAIGAGMNMPPEMPQPGLPADPSGAMPPEMAPPPPAPGMTVAAAAAAPQPKAANANKASHLNSVMNNLLGGRGRWPA